MCNFILVIVNYTVFYKCDKLCYTCILVISVNESKILKICLKMLKKTHYQYYILFTLSYCLVNGKLSTAEKNYGIKIHRRLNISK